MQAFYINLERDQDRHAFVEGQLARVGVRGARIPAVTPADLTEADRAAIRRIDAASSKTRAFCITLSHLAAMRAVLASGDAYGLVLEDDVLLSQRLAAFLAAFEAARPDLDLLRLETSGHLLRMRPPEQAILGFGICRAYSFEGGRAGYIVSRRGAEIMLAGPEMRRLPHDVAMFDPYQKLARRIVVRQLNPALIMQAQYREGDGPRFIDPPGRAPTLRELGWRAGARHIIGAVRRDTVVAVQKAWHQHVRGAHKRRVPFVAE